MSFVFFDTETTGLRYGFDQIVHFAAVRTDANLQEIDRFEVRSRLQQYVVPHPAALRTNRLPITRLTDPQLPSHYEMICAIRRKLLEWSPSIFVGYNSIRFDEEMLRHAFFQALHPAYLTSNHGNCRADVLGLVMAASALSPVCLVVPPGPEGRPTFRLDHLAPANGVEHDRAHDAMADVLATLSLCRIVNQRSPEVWQRFVRFSKKATVADFVEAEDGFVLTEFFGNQAYHTPVVCLGPDPGQPNGRLALDLRADLGRLAGLSDDALRDELAQKPNPIRRFRINAAPTLAELWDAPSDLLGGLELDDAEARARRLKEDPALRERLISAYVAGREVWAVSPHLEARIYDGFPGPDDEGRAFEFHDATWAGRVAIVERFEDERLKAFGRRLIYVERRSALRDDIRLEVDLAISDRLLEDRGGALTLSQALEETDALLSDGSSDIDGLLTEYRAYLVDRIARVTHFRASVSPNATVSAA